MTRRPPSTDPERRRFLTQAAAIALVGAAGGLPREAPALAGRWRDAWLLRRLSGHRPVHADGVRAWAHEEGIVLGRDAPEWVLNESAALVWVLCDGTRTVDALAREVAEVFGERPRRVRGDVARAVRDLMRLGCLQLDGSRAAPAQRRHGPHGPGGAQPWGPQPAGLQPPEGPTCASGTFTDRRAGRT